MKPIVLLDVDGVLADYVGGVCYAAWEKANAVANEKDVTEWSIEDSLQLNEEQRAIVKRAIRAPGFCACLKPIAGSRLAVRTLLDRADVYFVTTPTDSPFWMHERTAWLQDYYGAAFDKIIFTHEKHLVRGDVIIDDKLSNVLGTDRAASILWATNQNKNEARLIRELGQKNASLTATNSWDNVLMIVAKVGHKLSRELRLAA